MPTKYRKYKFGELVASTGRGSIEAGTICTQYDDTKNGFVMVEFLGVKGSTGYCSKDLLCDMPEFIALESNGNYYKCRPVKNPDSLAGYLEQKAAQPTLHLSINVGGYVDANAMIPFHIYGAFTIDAIFTGERPVYLDPGKAASAHQEGFVEAYTQAIKKYWRSFPGSDAIVPA